MVVGDLPLGLRLLPPPETPEELPDSFIYSLCASQNFGVARSFLERSKNPIDRERTLASIVEYAVRFRSYGPALRAFRDMQDEDVRSSAARTIALAYAADEKFPAVKAVAQLLPDDKKEALLKEIAANPAHETQLSYSHRFKQILFCGNARAYEPPPCVTAAGAGLDKEAWDLLVETDSRARSSNLSGIGVALGKSGDKARVLSWALRMKNFDERSQLFLSAAAGRLSAIELARKAQ